jgi:NADH-quinone oxidoreductase subunit C
VAGAPIFDTLQQAIVPAAGPAVVTHGALAFVLAPAELLPVVQRLKEEFAFDLFLDVTRVPEADPTVDSLVPLYGSAAFMERECHDMYGIRFRGNADLRPILLYEGFVGHPLRKDYPKQQEQPLVPYRN